MDESSHSREEKLRVARVNNAYFTSERLYFKRGLVSVALGYAGPEMASPLNRVISNITAAYADDVNYLLREKSEVFLCFDLG